MQIEELLLEFNIPIKRGGEHHHVTSNFIGIDCPFCSPNSGKFLLGIGIQGLGCNCWRCGKKGLWETLHEATGLPYSTIKEKLSGVERSWRKNLPVAKGKLVLPKGVGELLPAHKHYLKKRGFDCDELVKLWGLGGIGLSVRLPWRIFIPITLGGKVVSWTTRTIGKGGLRYISAKPSEEVYRHRTLLFGEDFAMHSVVVVEGCFDVFRIGPGCVATFGTSYTKAQVGRIARFPKRVICFDRERKAQIQAKKLAKELSCFEGSTYVVLLECKDPGEMDPQQVQDLRKKFLT